MSVMSTPRNSPPGRLRHRSPSVVLINDQNAVVTDAMASLDSQPPAHRRYTAKAGDAPALASRQTSSQNAGKATGNPSTRPPRGQPATRRALSSYTGAQSRRSPPRLDAQAIFSTNDASASFSANRVGTRAGRPSSGLTAPPPHAMGAFPKGQVKHATTRAHSAAVRARAPTITTTTTTTATATAANTTVRSRAEDRSGPRITSSATSDAYDYAYHIHPLYTRRTNTMRDQAAFKASHPTAPLPLPPPAAAASTTTATATRRLDRAGRPTSPTPATAGVAQAHTVGQLFNRRASLIEHYAAATGTRTVAPSSPVGAALHDGARDAWSSDDDSDAVPDALKPLQGRVGQDLYLRQAPAYDPTRPLNADAEKPFTASTRLRADDAGLTGPALASGGAGGGADPAKKDSSLFSYLSSYRMGQEGTVAEATNASTFDASASPLQSAMKRTSPPNVASGINDPAGGSGGTNVPPPLPPAAGPVATSTTATTTPPPASLAPLAAPGSATVLSPRTVHFADDLPPPPPGLPVPLPVPDSTASVPVDATLSSINASNNTAGSTSTATTAPAVPELSPEEKARRAAELAELKLLKELAEADARLRTRELSRLTGTSATPAPSSLEELLGASNTLHSPVMAPGRPRTAANFYGWQAPPANVLLPSMSTGEWHLPSNVQERLQAEEARRTAVAALEAEKNAQRRGFRGVASDTSSAASGTVAAAKAPHHRQHITQLVQTQQSGGGEVDYQACFDDVVHPERVTQRLYASMEAQARGGQAAATAAPATTTTNAEATLSAGSFMSHDVLPPATDESVTPHAAHAHSSHSTLATQAVVLRNAVSLLSCEHLAKDVGTERAVTRGVAGQGADVRTGGGFRGPSQSTAIASSVFRAVPPPGETFCELSYPAKVLLSAILYVRALGGLPTLLRVQPLTTFSPVMDKSDCLELVFLNPAKAAEEEAARRLTEQQAEAERQRIALRQQQQFEQQTWTGPNSPQPLGRHRGRSAPSSPAPTTATSAFAVRRPSNVETQLMSMLRASSQRRRSSPLSGQSPSHGAPLEAGPSMSFSGETTPLPLPTAQRDSAFFADIPYVHEDMDGGSLLLEPQASISSAFLAAVPAGLHSVDSSAVSLSAGGGAALVTASSTSQPSSILRRMGSERRSAPRVDVAGAPLVRPQLRRSSSVVPIDPVVVGGGGEGPSGGGATTTASPERPDQTARAGSAAEKEVQWRAAVSAALQNGRSANIWSPSSTPGVGGRGGGGFVRMGTPPPPPQAPKPPSTPTRKGESHVNPIEDELCVVVRAVLANKSTVHRFGTSEVVHVLPPLPRTGGESLDEKVAREAAMSGGVEGLFGGGGGLVSESSPLMRLLASDSESAVQRRTQEANRKLYAREQMKRQNARGPVVINEDGKPTAEDFGDLTVALLLSGGASQLSGILPDSMELESLRYKIFSLQGYSAKDPFGINRTQNQRHGATDDTHGEHGRQGGQGGQGVVPPSSPSFANWTRTRSIASMASLFGEAGGAGGAGRSRGAAAAAAAAAKGRSPEASFSFAATSTTAPRGRSASMESVLAAHLSTPAGRPGQRLGTSAAVAAAAEAAERQRAHAEVERLQRCQQQFPLYRASTVSESTLEAYYGEARAARRQGQRRAPVQSGSVAEEDKNRELREAERELSRFRPLRLDCFYTELVDAVQFALDMQVRQTKEKVMQAFHM